MIAPESTLLQQVVEEDHRLEKEASRASTALMQHRWRWTLDESNPQRMSLRAYAEAVGKGKTTITADAQAYVEILRSERSDDPARRVSPGEARERARMGAEKEAATEAIANARGLSFQHVRQDRPSEIRRVRDIAQERAGEHGTSIEVEAPRVADWIVRSEQAEQRQQEDRKQKLGLGYIKLEGKVLAAKRDLIEAVRLADDYDLDQEERELLAHTVDSVRRLVDLIDRRLAGAANVDWEQELRVIEGTG